MNQVEKVASRIVGGITIGITAALITHYRDERRFEPNLREKAKALDTKLINDGAVLAENLTQAKQDVKKLASEKN